MTVPVGDIHFSDAQEDDKWEMKMLQINDTKAFSAMTDVAT